MKPLFLFLVFIVGIPIAHAGELDGKGLICSAKKQKSFELGIIFKNEGVETLGVYDRIPLKITRTKGTKLEVYTKKIWFFIRSLLYTIDREELTLHVGSDQKYGWYDCKVSSPDQVIKFMNERIDVLKASMKTNKL